VAVADGDPGRPANYGTFIQLRDQSEVDLRSLVEAQVSRPRPDRRPRRLTQIGDLYASFMNEAEVNRLGAEPLKTRLAAIDAVNDTRALATLLGQLAMIGLPGAIGNYVDADAGDPTVTAIYLDQAGTALPDRDYYLKDEARLVDARAKYGQYLERVFTLAGRPNPAEEARAALAVETALAKAQWTQTEDRDAVKTYNKMAVSAIAAEMPGFDWMLWARPQGIERQASWGGAAAVVLQGVRGHGANNATRELESVARGPGHYGQGTLPERGVCRRAVRFLRPHAQRPREAARSLEARRAAGQHVDW
jgi:putative endopeptidase